MLNGLEEPNWQTGMLLAFEREERFRKSVEVSRRFQVEGDTVASLRQLDTAEKMRRDVMESERIRKEVLEGERVRREITEASRLREYAAHAKAEDDWQHSLRFVSDFVEAQPTFDLTPLVMNQPAPDPAPPAITPVILVPLTRSERLNGWLKAEQEKRGFVWYLGITGAGFVLAVLGTLFALLALL